MLHHLASIGCGGGDKKFCLAQTPRGAIVKQNAIFAQPAFAQGLEVPRVGSVVALGAAAGRTMSPVAAVNLMCAQLTQTQPAALMRRVAVPCILGTLASILVGMFMANSGR